jgi:hypothetical protein
LQRDQVACGVETVDEFGVVVAIRRAQPEDLGVDGDGFGDLHFVDGLGELRAVVVDVYY